MNDSDSADRISRKGAVAQRGEDVTDAASDRHGAPTPDAASASASDSDSDSDSAPNAAASSRLLCSHRAGQRLEAAAAALAVHGVSGRALVIGPTLEAGSRVLRRAVDGAHAAFGWQRATLTEFAARLASVGLARASRVQTGQVVLDAICARTIHRLREEAQLGRYARVGDRPGLPRALARTFVELGLAGVAPTNAALEPDLARCFAAYRRELEDGGLADRADVLRAAIERASDPAPHPLLDVPLVLLDPAVTSVLERDLFATLAARVSVVAVIPSADRRARTRLEEALHVSATELAVHELDEDTSLRRLRRRVFARDVGSGKALDDSVELLSAPGESRECVEIARRVLASAREGVPFDRMAVLTHAPARYRVHLVEALRRAGVPAWFSRGTVAPDPSGRALLALLACRERKLSARAFSEYLSLGAVPDPDERGAPPASDREVGWSPPAAEETPFSDDGELSAPERSASADNASIDDNTPVVRGTLRAPWRWERLLVSAAVIDSDRWRRRLEGLGHQLDTKLSALEVDDPARESLARRRRDLDHLMAFALPLVDDLAALPEAATWGAWAGHLERLARRAIRAPERVLAVLRELGPMAPIGPVGLAEVQLVLGRRLSEMSRAPSSAPAGKLFVGSTREARGLAFDVVFIPGLVERVFPKKVVEDPILLDAARRRVSAALATGESRVEDQRLALHLAIGAAEHRVVISYPRLDTERGRARVPSFYALEVLRAVEGTLPSFEELGRRAEAAGAARMAWPAPRDPKRAIDGAEYDLAVLDELLRTDTPPPGAARYLLEANPHLARALRARYARWQHAKWTKHDGFANASDEAKEALRAHAPSKRAYSATALEQLAVCPYRFYLRSVLRLSPRAIPDAIEQLDPLTRGQLMHQVQHDVLHALRERGALPVTAENLSAAQGVLDEALTSVAARFAEEHAPAIERVFADAVQDARADLREWLARAVERPQWVPVAFELAFGMPETDDEARDPASRAEPVTLEEGLTLRGAIDLVEAREGKLAATDHKTGVAPELRSPITDGGRSLQPVLYARVLEVIHPDTEVVGGRLYYCTSRGRFESRVVPLSRTARDAVRTIAEALEASIQEGFLPAFPDDGACARCDYRSVCGPAEERRVRMKKPGATAAVRRVRKLP